MKIKFTKAKDPKRGVIEYAKVPSRTNSFMEYFVVKYKDGKIVCNCGDFIFRRPKEGCDHIKLVLGKITMKQYLEG